MRGMGKGALPLIAANIAGMFFGVYYYWIQLLSFPPLLWLFIPDCPLYVFAFAIALLLLREGKENAIFSFIVSAGLLKYGLWTLFALIAYRDLFFVGGLALVNGSLFVLHIGMASEAFVLRVKKCGVPVLAAGLAWFLLNDIMDYIVGTAPYLPYGADYTPVAAFSFVSTLVLLPLLWMSKRDGALINLGIYHRGK